MEEAKIFNAPLTIPAGPQGSIRVGKEGGNEEMKEDGFVVRPDVFNLENKRAGGCFFCAIKAKGRRCLPLLRVLDETVHFRKRVQTADVKGT